jgi:hypothetical protein
MNEFESFPQVAGDTLLSFFIREN